MASRIIALLCLLWINNLTLELQILTFNKAAELLLSVRKITLLYFWNCWKFLISKRSYFEFWIFLGDFSLRKSSMVQTNATCSNFEVSCCKQPNTTIDFHFGYIFYKRDNSEIEIFEKWISSEVREWADKFTTVFDLELQTVEVLDLFQSSKFKSFQCLSKWSHIKKTPVNG